MQQICASCNKIKSSTEGQLIGWIRWHRLVLTKAKVSTRSKASHHMLHATKPAANFIATKRAFVSSHNSAVFYFTHVYKRGKLTQGEGGSGHATLSVYKRLGKRKTQTCAAGGHTACPSGQAIESCSEQRLFAINTSTSQRVQSHLAKHACMQTCECKKWRSERENLLSVVGCCSARR